MIKILLTFFLIHSAWANEFRLDSTSARFNLLINKFVLNYRSESYKINTKISVCNLKLAQELNTEIFGQLPQKKSPQGLNFYLDKKLISISPTSSFGNYLISMDARMMQFALNNKKACK